MSIVVSPHRGKQDAGQVLVLGRLFAQARPGLAQAGFGLAPPPGIEDEAGLPDASHKKLWRTQDQPEPEIIVSIVGMVPVADRTAQIVSLIVPGTAARVAPAQG